MAPMEEELELFWKMGFDIRMMESCLKWTKRDTETIEKGIECLGRKHSMNKARNNGQERWATGQLHVSRSCCYKVQQIPVTGMVTEQFHGRQKNESPSCAWYFWDPMWNIISAFGDRALHSL